MPDQTLNTEISNLDSYTNLNQDNASYENLTQLSGLFDKKYLDPFINGYGYIFITKPNLFINPLEPRSKIDPAPFLAYENMTKDPFFVQFLSAEALNRNDHILPYMLSFHDYDTPIPALSETYSSNFLRIFSNAVMNFDTVDTTVATTDSFDTKSGYRMPLPTSKSESEGSGQFSIQVAETPNLDFTKLMGMWVNYISNITDGTFHANPYMVKNGTIDYMSSVYYFVTEPDGKTLKYWAKYTGCWPTAIPYSAQKFARGERTTTVLDLPFVFTVKEDMNPQILEEFNRVALGLSDFGKIENATYNYASSKYSILLNKEALTQTILQTRTKIEDENRDPLIFIKQGKMGSLLPDSTDTKFELDFPSSIYKNTFQYKQFDSRFEYFVDEY